MCVCVCVQNLTNFCPYALISTPNVRKFFSHSNFPIPYLWTAFCVPLSFVFFTKNNNLECRDVLKTVTVTSDQKRFGPYTAHNSAQMVKRFHGSRRFIFTGSWSATHVLLSFGFFYEKQAIRRRQFAAIDCDVFMCGSYRIAGSELPRGLGTYVRALY